MSFIENLPRFRGESQAMDKAIATIYELRAELVRLREESATLRVLLGSAMDVIEGEPDASHFQWLITEARASIAAAKGVPKC
jgi:hypothetical protein